ncbi:MAG: hypothetical protein HYX39_02865 [Bacteroidetes bacterium]|nr:hypothetical protein [Bacteroidota bacterium]
MKKVIFTLVIVTTMLISCKKKAETPPPNTGGSTTGGTPPAAAVGYNGQLNVLQNVILGFNSPPQNVIGALFYGSTVTNSAVLSVNAGTVQVNGITLKQDNTNAAGPVYADSTYNISGPPFNLTASGSGTVNAISLSYTLGYPTIADTASIPSVITRSLGMSITFTNVTVSDSLAFMISSGSASVSKNYAVVNNSVTVNFTSAQLSSLAATNNGGSFTINLLRNHFQAVNSKNYLIQLEKRYFKVLITVN